MNNSSKNILFIDLSTYHIDLPIHYKSLLTERIHSEAHIIKMKNSGLSRAPISYSRGALQIATCLKNEKHNIVYIVYSDEEDRKRISKHLHEADIVCFSTVTPTIDLAADLAKLFKQEFNSLKIIVGGPHCNGNLTSVLENYSDFDYVFSYPQVHYLKNFIKNIISPDNNIDGISFRDGNKIIVVPNKKNSSDVSLISPDYTLLFRNINMYSHNIRINNGCPYSCKFCAEANSLCDDYNLSLNDLKSELKFLSSSCSKGTLIHFSDSIFNISPASAGNIINTIMDFKQFNYSIDTKAELLNSDFIREAAKSNICYFRIGIDNYLNPLLKERTAKTFDIIAYYSNLIKGITPESIIHLYWITGLPGTTHGQIQFDADLIKELVSSSTVDIIGNRIFVPYPGTIIFNEPSKYGMQLLTKDFRKYDRLLYPVYRLDLLDEFGIYFGFMFEESMLLNAYRSRLSHNEIKIDDYNTYLNRNYI